MYRKARFTTVLLLLICFATKSFSQDVVSPYSWEVTAQKKGEGVYELTFSANAVSGWQLYGPNQVLGDVKMAELAFTDSGIRQTGNFTETGASKNIKSNIFDNQDIKVFEGKVQWKAVIQISGTVPAQLQGKLNYSYGRNDEFYPSTPFSFAVNLEGGLVSTTRILIPTIDIDHPVNDCGDTIKKDSNLFVIFL